MKKRENNLLYAEIPTGEVVESLKGFKKAIFPSKKERLKKMKKELVEMKEEIKTKKELDKLMVEKRKLAKPGIIKSIWKGVRRNDFE